MDVFTDNCGILNQFCPARDNMKLNCAHQLLVYADDVTILGVGIHSVQLNTGAVVVASKETELEASADKIKYMVMSRDQNAGRSRKMKIDNSSFGRVEEFKCLGTTLSNQNSFRKKLTYWSGNACHHSVQKLLSSSLLTKNLNMKIYRTMILRVVLYGCANWSLTLWEQHRLRVLENRVF